jgi:hypothetical protein
MNGDGLRDVVVSHYHGVDYYPRTGSTTFGARVPIVAQRYMDARGLTMGDMSDDGYEDVIVASSVMNTTVYAQVVSTLATVQVLHCTL